MRIVPVKVGRDYHMHDNGSDGRMPIGSLVNYLRRHGISSFSVTNHETKATLAAAQHHARSYGMEFLPGIELSSRLTPTSPGENLHVLVYGFNYRKIPPDFNKGLITIQNSKRELIERRCKASQREPIVIERNDGRSLSLSVKFDELERKLISTGKPVIENGSVTFNDGIMCFPLLAEINAFLGINDPAKGANIYMIVNLIKGYEREYQKVLNFLHPFNATLSQESQEVRTRWQPGNDFVPFFFEARQAIELGLEAGGVVGAAHPGETNLTLGDIALLQSYGLSLLEVYTSKHSREQVEQYLNIALQLGLKRTIGTDFHGEEMTPNIKVGTSLYCPDYPAVSIQSLRRLVRN